MAEEGGEFFVGASAGLVLFSLAVLGALAWFVWSALRTPPRFIRLAFAGCNVAIGLVLFGLVALALFPLFGSNSVSVGDPVSVGRGGVGVAAPVEVNFGRNADPDYERHIRAAYGAGASIAENNEVWVKVRRPSAGLWAAAIATLLFTGGIVLAWLVVLRGMLRRAGAGDPFDETNVRALRRLALLTMAGGLVVPIVNHFAMTAVVREAGGDGTVSWGLSVFAPVAFGVLLLALSEVWRYGIELQREAEATV